MKNNKIVVTIIYPSDPLGQKIGGAETFLKGFIKYAPADIAIELIGIASAASNYLLKKWTTLEIGIKRFSFMPLFMEKDENKKTIIPLALRFTYALLNVAIDYSGRIILFNRLEPAIIFRDCQAPKMCVIHNDIERQIKQKGSEMFWSKIPSMYFMLEKFIFSFMNKIFTVSNNSLGFYHVHYPKLKKRISFLPTWVDTTVFYPLQEDKESLRKNINNFSFIEEEKIVLFVGRLQEQKAPLRLLSAFKYYKSINSNARLIMIGEGNLKDMVINYIKENNLIGSVVLLEGMEQEKLANYYRIADAFLLTSNFEGMPMCVLEALGSGLPVVTTDVGEVKLVVSNGFSGEIVRTFETKDIAVALDKVLSSNGQYTKKNCIESICEYVPEKVLKLIFDKIRDLGEKNVKKREAI